MNPTAERIAQMSRERCTVSTVYGTSLGAILRAQLFRLQHKVHYVPLGGSVPLGVLAQVNAALELVEQIRRGVLPQPARVVVPLGSSGTAAGFALGFAIAKVEIPVIGVRVAPAIVANRIRVMQLGRQTARMIERITGEQIARMQSRQFSVVRDVYGGAYGRPVQRAIEAAQQLNAASGIRLDQTYSAKTFAIALELARSDPQPTLFWNTFDGRIL
jgi:D-cysteine desulfhydrase